MHDLLQLKGPFYHKANPARGGRPSLPAGECVTVKHIKILEMQLQSILSYWEQDQRLRGALVSVHYRRIVPKSRRIHRLLKEPGKLASDSVRGARFEIEEWDGTKRTCHVFTHFVSLETLRESVRLLSCVHRFLEETYPAGVTEQEMHQIRKNPVLRGLGLHDTTAQQILVDACFVGAFRIDRDPDVPQEAALLTLYATGVPIRSLLEKIGILFQEDRMLDETTVYLHAEEIEKLKTEMPYLIAMGVTDLTKIPVEASVDMAEMEEGKIPPPRNEPVIGVIDTPFDSRVYFHEWVESHTMVDQNIRLYAEDYRHGTMVDSILVDGPKGNPTLEDGCGRFRVRHFGVATGGRFSAFRILRQIRRIVVENRDIRVWNLSLGSCQPVHPNFISPVAAELDRLQNAYDIVFVIAGTNLAPGEPPGKRIGSPADSLNAIVVNSVDFDGHPASYTRVGPVLSFFHKPDVSYYGGDGVRSFDRMAVCGPEGLAYVQGTSFAAPWVARKLAYLMEVMGLRREVAKALLLDAAAGWGQGDVARMNAMGYGIVPQRMEDVIGSARKDEIRFVMTGQARAYETYNYNLPIPVEAGKHPFVVRATLVYFPACDRKQGVDYTTTEMDLHLGRLRLQPRKGQSDLLDIRGNQQSDPGTHAIYEEDARKLFRKWDNVKILTEKLTKGIREKKALNPEGLWGIRICMKDRAGKREDTELSFAIVVTLRELKGKDRYDEFIKRCSVRGWLVQALNVEHQVEVYQQAEGEIELLDE